jgi:hypothetical protein
MNLRKPVVLCFIAACILFSILAAQTPITSPSFHQAAELIPSDRRIDWSNVGIPSGIPDYPIFANVKDAPYLAAGDDITDDAQAIQKAISDCPDGMAVYLPEGIYYASVRLEIFQKSIVLRGAGPGKTLLRGSIRIYSWSSTDTANIISGSIKGSTTIEVDNATRFSPSQYVVLDQLNDSSFVRKVGYYSSGCTWCSRQNGDRTMGQIVGIATKSGNTLTLQRPLYKTFSSQFNPQIIKLSNQLTDSSGIENMSIGGTSFQYNIVIALSKYCWVKNIESFQCNKGHIQLLSSFGCEIRDSYFHHGVVYTSGSAYGIMLMNQCTDNLIENNIFYYLRHSMVLEGGGCGNVFGYNYSTRIFDDNYPNTDWLGGDIITHGAHPFMNLFEGNIAVKISLDNTWGSSSHNTFFRNHIERKSEGENKEIIYGLSAVNLEENNRFENILGNIFGTEGCGDSYEEIPYISNDSKVIWKLGYHYPSAIGMPSDTLVKVTLLSHGNFDYVTSSTIWDDSIADHILPHSLYRILKPSFFVSEPWPAIGPDVLPMVGILPAKRRFEILTGVEKNEKKNSSVQQVGVRLYQNYPNLFNSSTKISFHVPSTSYINLKVYDMLGREIATLVDGIEQAGSKSIWFSAGNLASGLYCYRLQAGGRTETKKLLLLR